MQRLCNDAAAAPLHQNPGRFDAFAVRPAAVTDRAPCAEAVQARDERHARGAARLASGRRLRGPAKLW